MKFKVSFTREELEEISTVFSQRAGTCAIKTTKGATKAFKFYRSIATKASSAFGFSTWMASSEHDKVLNRIEQKLEKERKANEDI